MIPVVAIVLDLIALGGFLWVDGALDPLPILVAAAVMVAVLMTEFFSSEPDRPMTNRNICMPTDIFWQTDEASRQT